MVAMADNLHGVVTRISAFISSAHTRASSGATWQMFGELLVQLLHQAVTALDAIPDMTGAQKKSLVLAAVGSLFDSVADRCVPVTLYPFWSVIRPATRTFTLAIASGAVESLLPITRSA